MIRKLRLKLVAICMAMVTAVLAAVFLSVFFAMRRNVEDLSRQLLHQVAQESGYTLGGQPSVGIAIDGDQTILLPYFTVNVYPRGGAYLADVTGGTYSNLDDSAELTAILQDCLSQPETEGFIQDYHLRYLRQDKGLYIRLAFVDASMERAVLREMMGSYLIIGAAALLLLLGVSVLLSRWATRPVERAWRQQRQFLSDASHELKTPLTVILSNAELLEAASLADRPARWADNIHSEAQQMKSLVEEMLTLARADNMVRTAVLSELSLSDVVTDCALAFEPVAFEAGKPLLERIEPDVLVAGDRDKLRQLAGILLDNAIKYGAPGGAVTLTLEKTDRQARLVVANPGAPIPPEQLSRLFERFYRADGSRGEQSGFGLGLPIAKVIAGEHQGTLRAESDAASTRFIFTMPLKK
ncbi:cell wall metabolism sensor histidine kinase WalK [uncultured Dysosmobacter sp.]|uniref:sensor histidine kinase n=1 Tax=uncultured Dysosmobacter sp. TaxID=2591384 RepID=UPI00261E2695|nr:HAMP domain-containing sensor histidine kinase [uncultured Dysosmobacter sp.]